MHRFNTFFATAFIFALFTLSISGQAPVIKPSYLAGDVLSVAAEKIVIKIATGEIDIILTDKTQYFRVPPDNPSLKAAIPATFGDIGQGDKVMVSGFPAEDKKSMSARAVYLTSQADRAQSQQKAQEDWRARGTFGYVDNFNPQTSVITVTVRGMTGERKIAVKPTADTKFYRYAPDSVEIGKAAKSKLSDVEPKDEIRILGNKNADGSEVTAEMIVTGAFQTKSGVIKSINLEKNEIVIADAESKKDVSIKITENAILRQYPAEIAERMARMQEMRNLGGAGLRPPGGGGGQTPPQMTPGQTPRPEGNGPRPGGGGGAGVDDSRFPAIKVTDLKVGEQVAVLSGKSADKTYLKAIKLFTGIEPFIKANERMRAANPSRSGGGASLSIPGLDGFGGN